MVVLWDYYGIHRTYPLVNLYIIIEIHHVYQVNQPQMTVVNSYNVGLPEDTIPKAGNKS